VVNVPVGSTDLPGLSSLAGFDVTSLFNQGSLDIVEGSFGGSNPITAGANIANAVRSHLATAQNGVALIQAVAAADGLSPATLITTLVSYAHALQPFDGVAAAAVGNAIAGLVPGTIDAPTAVADTAVAALAVANTPGSARWRRCWGPTR
jgi:hypothetical protein